MTRLVAKPSLACAAEPETSDEISVGQMYEYGETVPQDYATALHWYQLAAATRDSAAAARAQRVEQILDLRH
ncbi:MAG: SEL1-like repeat protein [Candidatus Cybelea sp.]